MMFLAVIGGAVGFGALIVFSAIWRGYVLSVLWSWFMVPTFGFSELLIAPAIGLSLIASFLTHNTDTKKDDDEGFSDKMIRVIIFAFFLPLFTLGTGFVVKQFM